MNIACRGIRGATTAYSNTKDAIISATTELLQQLIDANNIDQYYVASVFFTTTSDLNSEFPAVAARQMGWNDVALLCGHEMTVPDSLPRCIRILILINTSSEPQELVHVYLKEATSLRSDR